MHEEKKDFIEHHHDYLHDYIRFADVKAAGLITVNGLIIRLIFTHLSNEVFQTLHFFSLIGSIILAISIALSLFVVFPRTSAKSSKGLIFWENVTSMKKEDFIKEVKDITLDELAEKMIEQNYFLAVTATKKYATLRYAFYATFIGYGSLCISAILWLTK